MTRYAQLVCGPAGSGKSTFCQNVQHHCDSIQRRVHIVNLDPAAEDIKYDAAIDVRDLVSLQEVMEELGLGPNGGLLYCMEYLEENLDEWLAEALEAYIDDDYLIFDCPGQIELFSHVPLMRRFAEHLKQLNFHVCAVYLLDSQFVSNIPKYISGCMSSLSAMVQMELPHVNVLSKVDLVPEHERKLLDRFLCPDARLLLDDLEADTSSKYGKLNAAIASLLDDYNMVSFVPMDISSEDSVAEVLYQIDAAIQYGEDLEPRLRDEEAAEEM